MKATSLSFETLALAQESPEPVPLQRIGGAPINPMAFPNDWSTEVVLETRWQTDVRRSFRGSRPEKLSLSSRPSRSLEVSVLGVGREEAHALLQSALAHTSQSGVPVPLYCDQVIVKNVLSNRIFGDFRFRRFFSGGRIAIFPGIISPHRNSNSVIYATIDVVTPESIYVTFDPSSTRAPDPERDVVCPCIDVELVDSVSGQSDKDDLLNVSFSWKEIDGACSLPAIWPATTFDNPEVLSPYAQIADGLPIFPFDFDWSGGVSVSAVREIDSDTAGRTSIQEIKGLTLQKFDVSLLGYDRERAWAVLRWFDAMRGRSGGFYLLHPHQPWKLQSFPTLSLVRIDLAGDANQIAPYFRQLAAIRADGTIVVRKITAVEDVTTAFQITLESPLPDNSFIAVCPILRCSFDQDYVKEIWITDGVCRMEFSITEEPDMDDTGLTNGIGFVQQNTNFIEIPDCNLLVRAGIGNYWRGARSGVWPAGQSNSDRWNDETPSPDRQASTPRIEKYFTLSGVSPSQPAQVVRFPQAWQNNGQPAIAVPVAVLQHQLDPLIYPAQKHLWGSSGWTLLLCFTPQPQDGLFSPQSDRALMELEATNGNWLRLWIDRAGAPDGQRVAIQSRISGVVDTKLFSLDPNTQPYTVFITLRWDGSTFRAWSNGNACLASAQTFPIPTFDDYVFSRWFSGMASNSPITSSVLRGTFGVVGCANLVVSYSRPLDIAELNSLHRVVADIYRTHVATSTLY